MPPTRSRRQKFAIGAFLRRATDLIPLRVTGFLVLALAVFGFAHQGLGRSDLILLLACGSLAGLALLMMVLTTAGAVWAARRARKMQAHGDVLRLEAGTRSHTPYRTRGFWLPFVELDWRWLEPCGVESEVEPSEGGFREVVHPRRRGTAPRIVRQLEVRDVLGLSAIRWPSPWNQPVLVLPPRGLLQPSSLLHSLFTGDELSDPLGEPVGDRVEMRQYTPGDPPRLILWKVYARTRKLMVRVSERAITVQPRCCAYLVAGPGDDAVASLARAVLESEILGLGWRFGADGSPEPAASVEEALSVLAHSGNPQTEPTGLAAFLRKAAADGFKSCLVFVPPVYGGWLEQVLKATQGAALHLSFITAASHAPAEPAWRQVVLRPDTRPSASPRVLETLGKEHPMLTYDGDHGSVRREAPTRTRKAAV